MRFGAILLVLLSLSPVAAHAQPERPAAVVVEARLTGRSRAPRCRARHVAGVVRYRVQQVLRGRVHGSDLYAIVGCPRSPRWQYGPQWGDRAVFRRGAVHRLALSHTSQPWRGMRLYDDFRGHGGRRWWVTRFEVPRDEGPLWRMEPGEAAPPVVDEIEAAQLTLHAPERVRPDEADDTVRVEAPSTWWDRRDGQRLRTELTFAGQPLHLVRVSPEVLEAHLPSAAGGRRSLRLEVSAPGEAPIVETREVVVEELRLIERVAGRADSELPWWQAQTEVSRERDAGAETPYQALVTTRPDPLFLGWLALLGLSAFLAWSWASRRRRATHVATLADAGRTYRDNAATRWRVVSLESAREIVSGVRLVVLGPWRLVFAAEPVMVVRPGGREEVRTLFMVESDTTLILSDSTFATFVDDRSELPAEAQGPDEDGRDPDTTSVLSDGLASFLRRGALAATTVALAAGACIAASASVPALARAIPFAAATLSLSVAFVLLARLSGAAKRLW